MATIMIQRAGKNEADHEVILINGRSFKIPKGVEVSIPTPKKPQTNADRIRAMSDEELAVILTAAACGSFVTETGRRLCYEKYLDFLKQPVKDGEE